MLPCALSAQSRVGDGLGEPRKYMPQHLDGAKGCPNATREPQHQEAASFARGNRSQQRVILPNAEVCPSSCVTKQPDHNQTMRSNYLFSIREGADFCRSAPFPPFHPPSPPRPSPPVSQFLPAATQLLHEHACDHWRRHLSRLTVTDLRSAQ